MLFSALTTRAPGASAGFRLEPARNPNDLTHAISRYFEGELTAINILPVQTSGMPFQRDVWRALRDIPCGTAISYAKLAGQIGRPAAVRAVGLANGSNPVGVVVPCHRVIGANGSLTGYGGGIERKSWLLEHEASANDEAKATSSILIFVDLWALLGTYSYADHDFCIA
jgi:methylated-DNA-[protein]-cysteine S-methyltransferase